MPYGYIGTDKDQTKANAGVLSISELAYLDKIGKLGGSLDKLQQITSTSTSSMVFNDLRDYQVHYLQMNNFDSPSATTSGIGCRVSADGGSTFLSSSGAYRRAFFRVRPSGSTTTLGGTATYMDTFFSVDSDYSSSGGYAYFFNMLDANKRTIVIFHSSLGVTDWGYYGGFAVVGTGAYNSFELMTNADAFSGTATLYGLKEVQ